MPSVLRNRFAGGQAYRINYISFDATNNCTVHARKLITCNSTFGGALAQEVGFVG